MFKNDLPTLKLRVSTITAGATLYAKAPIRPPRPTHWKFHTFVAERLTIIVSETNGQPA